MKIVLGYFALALVLLLAGGGLWATGRLEQRVVNARTQLLTMRYDAPLNEYDLVERSVRYASDLPWVAALVADVRGQRATSKYWAHDYPSLTLARDAGGAMVEQDPALVLVAANAAFRRTRIDGSDRSASQQLDDILGLYVDVLKRAPHDFDAAYNYEFVARTRDTLARPRAGRSGREKPTARVAASTQTIHGRPGAPPDSTNKDDFKIIVPQDQEERQQVPEAGVGGAKVRKG